MWTYLRLRFAALFRRTRFEHELADELAFHIESRAAEWERRGLSPSAARRKARIELGSAERIKEEVRDQLGPRPLRLTDAQRRRLAVGG